MRPRSARKAAPLSPPGGLASSLALRVRHAAANGEESPALPRRAASPAPLPRGRWPPGACAPGSASRAAVRCAHSRHPASAPRPAPPSSGLGAAESIAAPPRPRSAAKPDAQARCAQTVDDASRLLRTASRLHRFAAQVLTRRLPRQDSGTWAKKQKQKPSPEAVTAN
jgi:hypothetical protein